MIIKCLRGNFWQEIFSWDKTKSSPGGWIATASSAFASCCAIRSGASAVAILRVAVCIKEGGPISYEARPSASFQLDPPASPPPFGVWV